MKFKRNISYLLVLVMIMSIMFVWTSNVFADGYPVQLLYSKVQTWSSGGNPPYSFNGDAYGYIEVENLAYTKNVVVHYTMDGVNWADVNATYVGPTHGNYDAWRFETPEVNSGYRGTISCRFAIMYEVDGNTYWDNNNGNNYYVSSGGWGAQPVTAINGSVVVANEYYADSTTFYGNVFVKNIAYNKIVQVRYTLDDWETYSEASASYTSTDPYNGYEKWSFSTSIPSGADIQFAISYQVNGQTYWDNNFSSNYSISGF